MKKVVELLNYTFSTEIVGFSFVTLTLSSPQKKDVDYYKLLKKFIEKIQYHYAGCKYIWKAEHQENNNVHFHLLLTKKIEWQFVRSVWNRIQKVHVDDYQNKMKLKYKKGYYYDENMCNSSGKKYTDEEQKKIYNKNYRANFRNPNSTDVKIIDNKENKLQSYLYKYICKEEEKKIEDDFVLKRYWGCSDELKLLRYAKIMEADVNNEIYKYMTTEHIKTIEEEGIIKCKIYNKLLPAPIKIVEDETINNNRNLVLKDSSNNKESATKIIKRYQKTFEF